MIPFVGTVCTNEWYCPYQWLVVRVPIIGTMTKETAKLSEKWRDIMPYAYILTGRTGWQYAAHSGVRQHTVYNRKERTRPLAAENVYAGQRTISP
ncbi:MAG: hypothetical protein SPI30_05730 [Prevotella sp.]|nr:hypothetical protein [Prevotella sp.]